MSWRCARSGFGDPDKKQILRLRRRMTILKVSVAIFDVVGEGAGWVELQEFVEVLFDFGDGYFVDDVVVGGGGQVEVFEDAGAGVVEGEPLDCGGPGGRDDDHGETHGAG
jgi:hypothetical protein